MKTTSFKFTSYWSLRLLLCWKGWSDQVWFVGVQLFWGVFYKIWGKIFKILLITSYTPKKQTWSGWSFDYWKIVEHSSSMLWIILQYIQYCLGNFCFDSKSVVGSYKQPSEESKQRMIFRCWCIVDFYRVIL